MTRGLALIALVAAMIAGCNAKVGDPVVDGWPIGAVLACAPTQDCQAFLATASAALDRRDPGHAAVVEVTLHSEGKTVDSSGDQILTNRSGDCCYVARFRLADGSLKAIGVGYPGISTTPIAVDYGP